MYTDESKSKGPESNTILFVLFNQNNPFSAKNRQKQKHDEKNNCIA